MAAKKPRPRKSDAQEKGTARKTKEKVPGKGNAREMAERVKRAFDQGYRGDATVEVEYEKSEDGIGADHIFFHELIFRSIRKNHGGGDPPTPEPPEPTKRKARLHGQMVKKIQPTGPVRLVNVFTTFYKIKDTDCPGPDPNQSAERSRMGAVCDF